jgi:hypothetical protein
MSDPINRHLQSAINNVLGDKKEQLLQYLESATAVQKGVSYPRTGPGLNLKPGFNPGIFEKSALTVPMKTAAGNANVEVFASPRDLANLQKTATGKGSLRLATQLAAKTPGSSVAVDARGNCYVCKVNKEDVLVSSQVKYSLGKFAPVDAGAPGYNQPTSGLR